jgi:hypothetical protein
MSETTFKTFTALMELITLQTEALQETGIAGALSKAKGGWKEAEGRQQLLMS